MQATKNTVYVQELEWTIAVFVYAQKVACFAMFVYDKLGILYMHW